MARALRKTSWEYLETIFHEDHDGEDQIKNEKSKISENTFRKNFSKFFGSNNCEKHDAFQHFSKFEEIFKNLY